MKNMQHIILLKPIDLQKLVYSLKGNVDVKMLGIRMIAIYSAVYLKTKIKVSNDLNWKKENCI